MSGKICAKFFSFSAKVRNVAMLRFYWHFLAFFDYLWRFMVLFGTFMALYGTFWRFWPVKRFSVDFTFVAIYRPFSGKIILAQSLLV